MMADAGGRIGVTELQVGVAFPLTALEILAFAMGEPRAREAVVTAAAYPPAEALARGFVDELVSADGLVEAAVAAAGHLCAQVPADTYRLTKAQLRLPAADRLERNRDTYDPRTTELWIRRAEDGWLRRYMEQLTSRR
jgi:enoyl-CoA hydratase